jgi:hypothetical protein
VAVRWTLRSLIAPSYWLMRLNAATDKANSSVNLPSRQPATLGTATRPSAPPTLRFLAAERTMAGPMSMFQRPVHQLAYLSKVEVDHEQVDGGDPMRLRGHVLGTSRRASKPPWIVGVQGFDAAVQHFRKTGVVRLTGKPAASSLAVPPVDSS